MFDYYDKFDISECRVKLVTIQPTRTIYLWTYTFHNIFHTMQGKLLVAELIYNSKCPSVLTSVCLFVSLVETVWRKREFLSTAFQDRRLNSFVKIPLINEHLFWNYFVRLSVGYALTVTYSHILFDWINWHVSQDLWLKYCVINRKCVFFWKINYNR